jgi:large subunit ribosomal protein L13
MGVMRDGHARGVPTRVLSAVSVQRCGASRSTPIAASWCSQLVQTDTTTIHTRRLRTVRTFSPKDSDITRRWHVIDASDIVLGRLASHVAVLLRGKHKPIFAPHVDTGDFVIVVNASKVALSGSKLEQKHAYRHSGYPGGLRAVSYASLMATSPERAVEKAVKGMLPKNSLGRKTLRKLKVYAGPDHPHQAQQPQPYEITQLEQ